MITTAMLLGLQRPIHHAPAGKRHLMPDSKGPTKYDTRSTKQQDAIAERQAVLIALLRQDGPMRVAEIVRALKVCRATACSDLCKLELAGKARARAVGGVTVWWAV